MDHDLTIPEVGVFAYESHWNGYTFPYESLVGTIAIDVRRDPRLTSDSIRSRARDLTARLQGDLPRTILRIAFDRLLSGELMNPPPTINDQSIDLCRVELLPNGMLEWHLETRVYIVPLMITTDELGAVQAVHWG